MKEGLVDIKGQTTPPWKTGHTSKTLKSKENIGSPRDGDARGLTETLSAVGVQYIWRAGSEPTNYWHDFISQALSPL